MQIEYTTKCVDGGVTISLTVKGGTAAKVTPKKNEKKDGSPLPPVGLQNSLAETQAKNKPAGLGAKDAKEEGSGDVDPTETGSGPGTGGLVIIIGPVLIGCGKLKDDGGGDVGQTGTED